MNEQPAKETVLRKTLRVLVQQMGLTPEEVTQLRLSHLHLAGKNPSISFTDPVNHEPKTIGLDLEAHRALVRWLVLRPDSVGDFLFPGNGAEAMDPAEIKQAIAVDESEPVAVSEATPPLPSDSPRPSEAKTASNSRPVPPLSRPETGTPPVGLKTSPPPFGSPPATAPEAEEPVIPLPTSAPKSGPHPVQPPKFDSAPVRPPEADIKTMGAPERPPASASPSRPVPIPPKKEADLEKAPPVAATVAPVEEKKKAPEFPTTVKAKESTSVAGTVPPRPGVGQTQTPLGPRPAGASRPVELKRDRLTAQQAAARPSRLPRLTLVGGAIGALVLCVACIGGGSLIWQSSSTGEFLAGLGLPIGSSSEDGSGAEATEIASDLATSEFLSDSPVATPTLPPTSTATPPPVTATPLPTETATPTSIPTDTPIPADTATPTPTETPVPTNTPVSAAPAATEEPAITPTPGMKYPAPQLLEPQDDFGFIYGNTIVLRWQPVDLAPDEQYAVRITYRFQGEVVYQGSQVKEPEWTIPLSLFGQIDGPENYYEWFVVVERLNEDGSGTPVSPESERRSFTWK